MPSVEYVLFVGLAGILTSAVGGDAEELITSDRACFVRLGCFDLGEPWNRRNHVPPPSHPDENTVTLFFYSRMNTEKAEVFNTYPHTNIHLVPFDGSRPTAVLIHDHRQNATMEWIHTVKYFYLLDMNSNILIADYSRACYGSYGQTVSNARVVSRLIARSLKHLIDHKNLHPRRIHLIGHGLGAHIASYIAKTIPGISRLTALDPLRPLFEGHDRRIRLDRGDASFVEVVHTNAIPFEGYGMVGPHGDVDFYFNDGGNQPGCLLPPGFPTIETVGDVFGLLSQYKTLKNSCNQDRAYKYFVEAYNSLSDCSFWARKMDSPPIADSLISIIWKNILSFLPNYRPSTTQLRDCTEDDCIVFGYDTIESPLRGVFVIRTNSHPPYCVSEAGLPL